MYLPVLQSCVNFCTQLLEAFAMLVLQIIFFKGSFRNKQILYSM